MRIELAVEHQNNVSGHSRHGAIYPMFSSWANFETLQSTDCENSEVVLYRKITIEDGRFQQASRRAWFTGQHTDLAIKLNNGICRNAPQYVYGELFSRNKYGQTRREFRLDLINKKIQIKKGKNGKWFDFKPSRYID